MSFPYKYNSILYGQYEILVITYPQMLYKICVQPVSILMFVTTA